MRLRRIGRGGLSRAPRRKATLEWFGGHTSPTDTFGEPGQIVLAIGTGFADWVLNPDDAIQFYDEPTLLRSLLYFTVLSTSPAGGGTDRFAGWAGIVVVKADTATPPVVLPQLPSTDWLWWYPFIGGNAAPAGGSYIAGYGNATGGELFDIRSKRKIQQGNGLAFYCNAAPATVTEDGFQFSLGFRMLLKH